MTQTPPNDVAGLVERLRAQHAATGSMLCKAAADTIEALAPAPVAQEGELPAGMVPWAGGGSAPEDWDGGPVARRRSNVRPGFSVGSAGHVAWWTRHESKPGRRHLSDIVAYTPKAPQQSQSTPGAGIDDGDENAQEDAQAAVTHWFFQALSDA